MIAKIIKGGGFRGALEYDLNEEKGLMLDTNMAGQTPRELAKEFGEIRKLRPNLGKAVLHVSLSASPGENLTDQQWREIGQRYLRGMGFKDNQHVITRHTDTEHEHIHILANRITHGGEVVSDSRDYQRQETIMREIEREYGLAMVKPSIEAERRAPTKGEIEHGVRTGQPSTRQQLQQLADAAAKDCRSFSDYAARLEVSGVELVPVAQLEGAKLSGLSYRLDGVTMKGSDLGKAYSPAGLAKRGVTYEKNRDFETVRRCIERDALRAFGEPDRPGEASQSPERGGFGRDDRAVGAGDGRIDGRDPADLGRDRAPEPGAQREVQQPGQRSGQDLERSVQERAGISRRDGQGWAADGVDALRADGGSRDALSGARDRILALSETADHRKYAELQGASQGADTRDRSLEAIRRQTQALGVERFEVGIREAKTGLMMNREWSRAELEQAAPWLKRMNARGNDIYIRPAGEHGLVLVDDLKPAALEKMREDGYAPALTVETSPGNYQAWVKLSDKKLSKDVRDMAAKSFAHAYGGDPASAESRHYGRLAGFTNRKQKYTRDGKQPYVLAQDSNGEIAKSAPEGLRRIEMALDAVYAKQEQKTRLEAIKEGPKGYLSQWNPVQEYQRQAQRLLTQYGKGADLSRMDWMIATNMAKSGRFKAEEIEKSIRECSPNIESRKAGHIEDYAKRTAEKAWNAPEVQTHRQEQARQALAHNYDGPSLSR
jgi:hypothetical protein